MPCSPWVSLGHGHAIAGSCTRGRCVAGVVTATGEHALLRGGATWRRDLYPDAALPAPDAPADLRYALGGGRLHRADRPGDVVGQRGVQLCLLRVQSFVG